MRHPAADRDDLLLVHVTHFNALFWDAGATPTRVIEHGIVDPGQRYTGELPRGAVVINEARRRARVTGTDLLDRFAAAAPLDLFGIDAGERSGGDRGPAAGASCTTRWRAGASTCTRSAGPRSASRCSRRCTSGCRSSRSARRRCTRRCRRRPASCRPSVDVLAGAHAAAGGRPRRGAPSAALAARAAALERYGLDRFLADWDDVLEEVARR